jgi:hypothetical protein
MQEQNDPNTVVDGLAHASASTSDDTLSVLGDGKQLASPISRTKSGRERDRLAANRQSFRASHLYTVAGSAKLRREISNLSQKSGATGEIDRNSILEALENKIDAENSNKSLKKTLFYVVAAAVAICSALLGLMFFAIETSKESHVVTNPQGSARLLGLDGKTVETKAVETIVTLWSLPLLSSQTLAHIHHLTIPLNIYGREATYEIASAETYGPTARLLTTDGSTIDIDMATRIAKVASHGKNYVLNGTAGPGTPWTFPGTNATGRIGYTRSEYEAARKIPATTLVSASSTGAVTISGDVTDNSGEPVSCHEPEDTQGLSACGACITACDFDPRCGEDFCGCMEGCKAIPNCTIPASYTPITDALCAAGARRERVLGSTSRSLRTEGRKLFYDYGCCSTSHKFITGQAQDTADCFDTSVYEKEHKEGSDLSLACYRHDKCLHACPEGKNACRGICDLALANNAGNADCGWGDGECKAFRWAVEWAMNKKPNETGFVGRILWDSFSWWLRSALRAIGINFG